jgi:hypothetical protein
MKIKKPQIGWFDYAGPGSLITENDFRNIMECCKIGHDSIPRIPISPYFLEVISATEASTKLEQESK